MTPAILARQQADSTTRAYNDIEVTFEQLRSRINRWAASKKEFETTVGQLNQEAKVGLDDTIMDVTMAGDTLENDLDTLLELVKEANK